VRASSQEEDEIMARRTCSVEDAAKVLGIGRGHAYRLARSGELRVIHLGNRMLIPTDAIRELLTPA
jgi:excisionase family DNA binding protein